MSFFHTDRMNNTVSTIAGIAGLSGYQDGDGTQTYEAPPYIGTDIRVQFNCPSGVAVHRNGNLIVADFNHRIRKITPQGRDVSTLAGAGEEGHQDGEGTVAQFNCPTGPAVDGDGNVLVADTYNHCVRKITTQGQVFTLAGTGKLGKQDGELIVAQFNFPTGIAVDGDDNIIVADTLNHGVRKITPQGQVPTLASCDGSRPSRRTNCPTISAKLLETSIFLSLGTRSGWERQRRCG
jgi:sugar lactone lactonase YvrE